MVTKLPDLQPPYTQAFSLWQLFASAGALFVGLFTGIFGAWRAVRGDKEDIIRMKSELEKQIDTAGDDMALKFGDSLSAAREQTRLLEAKVHEVEIWNRDNFVSKRNFDMFVQKVENTMQHFEEKIDARFDRIDNKLDRLGGTGE